MTMRLAVHCLVLVPVLLLCGGLAEARADTYPRNPRVDVLNYRFAIDLQDRDNHIVATADIDIRFAGDGETALRFDLVDRDATGKGMAVSAVSIDGVGVPFVHRQQTLRIELPRPFRRDERVRLRIAYAGEPGGGLKIAANRYGDRTFFSDNWPDKARQWLPVVDHPYDKATCEMIVAAPAHYQVVSNGLLVEETDLPDGRRRSHWRQSVPIAPWLYVLGVARFAVQHVGTWDGKAIETWVYAQDRDAGFHDFAVPTRDALAFYAAKVGPFAYEKLANVQSNSVSGGMEAASAIFYSEGSVTGDRSVRWRNVVIHEIAHQWFGNAVTEYRLGRCVAERGVRYLLHAALHRASVRARRVPERARVEPPAGARLRPGAARLPRRPRQPRRHVEGHDHADLPEGRVDPAHAARHRR